MKKTKTSKRTAGQRLRAAHGSAADWTRDGVEFDMWFAGQQYSLGAIPNWTQAAEMRRTWCIARQTMRDQQNILNRTNSK